MCHHVFIQTDKTNISLCKKCGCITINSKPFIKPAKYDTQITEDQLLYIKKAIIKEKDNYHSLPSFSSLNPHYQTNRSKGIRQIRKLTLQMQYDQRVFYKAVLYLDLIYFSSSSVNTDLIKDIASICVLISLQYNENCTCIRIQSLFFILNQIPNFAQLEIECMKVLNYDLGYLSTYDYLMNLFEMGITCNENVYEIEKIYTSCLGFLDSLIEDERFIDFTASELAFAIIKCKAGNNKVFSLEDFSMAYGEDYHMDNHQRCYVVLMIIEKHQCVMKKPYKKKYFNKMNSNTSCSTVDSYELKI